MRPSLQILLQPAPLSQGVVAGLGQFAARRDLLADFHQPGFQRGHHRHALGLAQRQASLRRSDRLPGPLSPPHKVRQTAPGSPAAPDPAAPLWPRPQNPAARAPCNRHRQCLRPACHRPHSRRFGVCRENLSGTPAAPPARGPSEIQRPRCPPGWLNSQHERPVVAPGLFAGLTGHGGFVGLNIASGQQLQPLRPHHRPAASRPRPGSRRSASCGSAQSHNPRPARRIADRPAGAADTCAPAPR